MAATACCWERESWSGHKASVLCLGKLEDHHLVASGSEDATVRVWDTRLGRAVKCFMGGFDKEVGVQALSFVDNTRLFAASNTSLFELDLTSDRLITTDSLSSLPHISEEEINQIDVHHKNKHLALADDAGKVMVLDITRRPAVLAKTLYPQCGDRKKNRKAAAADALCTAVLFRPRVPWDLAVGYLNCGLAFWWSSAGRGIGIGVNHCCCCWLLVVCGGHDRRFSGGRATVLDTREEEEEENQGQGGQITGLEGKEAAGREAASAGAEGASESRLFNPPFVHALAFTLDGRHVAAGLGDSTIAIYDYARAMRLGVLRGGHTSSVAHLHFSGPTRPYHQLISIGNDQALGVWSIEEMAVGEGKATSSPGLRSELRSRVEGLPGKPNWSLSVGERVFVADTTPALSVLTPREG